MAKQSVEQTVRLAPFQEQFLADLFASAKALTGEGTQMPFAEQELADLSQGQKQAILNAFSGVGAFQPFLQQGSEAVKQGIAGAQGASFDPTSYQQFMDPYMEDVIARTQQDIADKGRQQQNQAQASAVGSGAFGGSRQAVLQGQIAADTMDQQARTGAQLRSAGFQQAQNLAQQQANQQLRQAQLAGQLGVSQAGLGQLGQQMVDYNNNKIKEHLMLQEQIHLQNRHYLINRLVLCLTSLEVFQHCNKLIQRPLPLDQVEHHSC